MNQIRNNPEAADLLRSIFSNDHERGPVTITTEKFIRKQFTVDAVTVTEDNIEAVAEWCKGEVFVDESTPQKRKYIKVEVHAPQSERQTKAYVHDKVLFAGKGFKIYPPKAFARTFDPVFVDAGDPNQGELPVHVMSSEEILPGITATRVEDMTLSRKEEPVPEGSAEEWNPVSDDVVYLLPYEYEYAVKTNSLDATKQYVVENEAMRQNRLDAETIAKTN